MNDIFENPETMKENEHPRFYTAESVMRGHPDKLCDLIADSVLDACLQHDPASRVACEVMATHGHIIVAGEITTSAKPDVFNIVRDTLRDVGYDPKGYQIDCYIHDQSPDIAGAVEPELAEPVFNLADCFVVVGVILGAVYYLWFYEKYDARKKDDATDADGDK